MIRVRVWVRESSMGPGNNQVNARVMMRVRGVEGLFFPHHQVNARVTMRVRERGDFFLLHTYASQFSMHHSRRMWVTLSHPVVV